MIIDYANYKHSYAHALAPKLRAINFAANVNDKPVNYIKGMIRNILSQAPDLIWTEKEQYFFDNCMTHFDSKLLYYYVKNAVNKAREIFVEVDDNGELI